MQMRRLMKLMESAEGEVADALRSLVEAMRGFKAHPHAWLLQEFMLRNGKRWTEIAPLPKRMRMGTPKLCFANSAKLAMKHSNLRYCEGYIVRIIPIHHAWCIDEHGRVIDATLRDPVSDYLGVAFTAAEYAHHSSDRSASLFDTGRGLNEGLILNLDPSMKAEVEASKMDFRR